MFVMRASCVILFNRRRRGQAVPAEVFCDGSTVSDRVRAPQDGIVDLEC